MKKLWYVAILFFSSIAVQSPVFSQTAQSSSKLETMLKDAVADNDVIATLTLLKVLDSLGLQAPPMNLCRIVLPNRNIYCKQNLGIERIKMPQLSGKPIPGTPAAKLPVDVRGEVNATEAFKKYLVQEGYEITSEQVPAADLKSTQNELIGSKVAGIWWALKRDRNNPIFKSPIFISSDNYVLDGHHRWAALTGTDFEDGELGNLIMNVMQVNVPMKKLVPLANNFAHKFGIMAEAGVKK